MAKSQTQIANLDPIWVRIVDEAEHAISEEPLLGGLMHACVLHHNSIQDALGYRIALKLASGEMSEQILREICDAAHKSDPNLAMSARADLTAVFDRDPACHRFLQPLV